MTRLAQISEHLFGRAHQCSSTLELKLLLCKINSLFVCECGIVIVNVPGQAGEPGSTVIFHASSQIDTFWHDMWCEVKLDD